MSFDPSEYKISIQRVEIDGDLYFEARVQELPDIREYGETYRDAYELAIDTIETAHSMFVEQGRDFPAPHESLNTIEYSGRITLRLPKTLHRQVAELAEKEEVSINQILVSAASKMVATAGAYASSQEFLEYQKGRYVVSVKTSTKPQVLRFLRDAGENATSTSSGEALSLNDLLSPGQMLIHTSP